MCITFSTLMMPVGYNFKVSGINYVFRFHVTAVDHSNQHGCGGERSLLFESPPISIGLAQPWKLRSQTAIIRWSMLTQSTYICVGLDKWRPSLPATAKIPASKKAGRSDGPAEVKGKKKTKTSAIHTVQWVQTLVMCGYVLQFFSKIFKNNILIINKYDILVFDILIWSFKFL